MFPSPSRRKTSVIFDGVQGVALRKQEEEGLDVPGRHILKQLFTSVLVKVVDIYLAASMNSCEMVCTLFAFILLNFFFQIFTPSPKSKAGLDLGCLLPSPAPSKNILIAMQMYSKFHVLHVGGSYGFFTFNRYFSDLIAN